MSGLGRVPDFFIVGHPKSGTTALYEMLRRHPQIFMPDVKEPRFFDRDHREQAGAAGYPLEDYLALFAPAGTGQITGEGSPSYLRSHVAAEGIAELAPDARAVAIFREPASFIRSVHLQLVQEHIETEPDLGRALSREALTRGGQQVRRYADRIDYVAQLRRFHDALGHDRVLSLVYDDFRADNAGTVRQVLGFLGVDASVAIEPVAANPTVALRAGGVDRALRRVHAGRGPLTRAARGAVRTLLGPRARAGALGLLQRRVIYREPEPPDESLMDELRRRFAAEVVAFGDYIDRDLVSLWGYEKLL
jgi:hypothetical protein